MKVSTLVTRATSALNKNVKYKSPGTVPNLAATSWPAGPTATDCSGFLSWCFRVSRKVDHPLYKKINGGWFETTGIHADVLASVGYFSQLDDPVVGSILVYPDFVGQDGNAHDGHIGLVVEVDGTKKGLAAVNAVIHCSVGNDKTGSAIQKTGPGIWLNHKGSVIGWRDDLEP